MPTNKINYSNLNFFQKQKYLITKDITKIHSNFTDANIFFALVIFEKNDKESYDIVGKLDKYIQ